LLIPQEVRAAAPGYNGRGPGRDGRIGGEKNARPLLVAPRMLKGTLRDFFYAVVTSQLALLI
jgi:hypothetical protein